MIKSELKSLWNNKLMILVLVAIVLIPAMYAGFFLASMWDPYGELEKLPVAVVNKDIATEYNGKTLSAGADLAKSLKENNSMAFNVVDEQTAKDGLWNGTYYMVITIPENFSENATTVMDEKPEKMQLYYETNPGKNYISMKLSESAIKQIKANINEQITKTYTETMFASLGEVADGFGDAFDGTVQMIEGEDSLIDGNKTITDGLDKLSQGTGDLKDGVDKLSSGTTTYTEGVKTVNEGLHQLDEGVSQLDKKAVTGAKDLYDGSKKLANGVINYTDGVGKVKDGTGELKKNNSQLVTGMNKIATGVNTVHTGSESMLSGLKQMRSSLNNGYTEENAKGIKLLAETALPGIQNG
ncbi:MAG: YhgE/Pip family protein, partial [Lachnospiraceae bacterium]|nr:YhgE/Pip family protein [Lachnospiraceae bacterium]